MFFGTLLTIPSATSTLQDIGSWSGAIFDDLFPYAKMIIGLVLPVLLIGALISYILRSFRH